MSVDPVAYRRPTDVQRRLGMVLWITAAGIVLFWVYFFAVENRRPGGDVVYLAFERSFPVPDLLWLTPLLVIGGRALRTGRASGVPWVIAAGGSMVFLGLLDASFNAQQGRYTIGVFEGMLNGFINVYCVVAGLLLIRLTWREHVRSAPVPASDDVSPAPPATGGREESASVTVARSPSLVDRHVTVTGGSSGIGLATAKKLAAIGAHVVILARDRERLDAAAAQIDAVRHESAQPCLALMCDVADADQVTRAFQDLADVGRQPEILINSAGVPLPGYFDRQPLDVFDRQMRINYFGTLYAIKQALPAMIERRAGHIVNISSVAGFLGVFGYSGYAASKFAVWGLSEVLRAELRGFGIAVSVVCPPDTDTPQLHEENKTRPPETKAIGGSIKPLSADQVADAIIRGIRRRRFCIIPDFQGKLLPPILGLARPLVHWILDRKVSQVGRTADVNVS